MKQTYYLLYKIINKLNGMIYVGIHKTQNKDDSYMGSGKLIQRAIKKHGIDNFKKTILKECKSQKELFELESQMVNESFVKRKDTYNLALGGYNGGGFTTKGTAVVSNNEGKKFRVSIKDPKFLNKQLRGLALGKLAVKDKFNKILWINKNDPRYLKGDLISINKGRVAVKDKKGNTLQVDINDPRFLSGELVGYSKGKVVVKNSFGKCFQVNCNDPRIGKTLSCVSNTSFKDKKHSEETKAKIGKINSIKQKGSLNSQFGKMWITNESENRKVSKDLKRLPKGFRKGRVIKFKKISGF